TAEKGLALLAQAIDELVAAGYPFMALFIGSGPERELLRNYGNSLVLDFMKWKDLAPYYRASDVAVWPRSISTSSLDASASGLPVIMSSSEPAKERWEGIGASYKDGDILSLKSVLLEYLDAAKRASDSAAAVSRMRSLYSWNVIAESYLNIIQG
ncbi:MAG: glycosyltransferase family 4 protein, partial [Nitrospira sp.]|nr:glycosyltransferase family 4 protein [Nitrospira sp.]